MQEMIDVGLVQWQIYALVARDKGRFARSEDLDSPFLQESAALFPIIQFRLNQLLISAMLLLNQDLLS